MKKSFLERSTFVHLLLLHPCSLYWYGYCGNNPINSTDPTGLFFETLWDVASVAMGVQSLITKSYPDAGEGLGTQAITSSDFQFTNTIILEE